MSEVAFSQFGFWFRFKVCFYVILGRVVKFSPKGAAMSEMDQFLKSYPWESEDHKKGFLGLVQHIGNLPESVPLNSELKIIAAFCLLKDKESYEHARDMVGDQITGLRKEIREMQLQIKEQKNMIGALTNGFKVQAMALRELVKPKPAALFSSLPPHPNDKA